MSDHPNQADKAAAFLALHEQPQAFAIGNAWDAGSAKLLAAMGFKALATTSAGFAFTLGRKDGAAGREAVLANARAIVEATDLPVSADLENGFGHDPEDAADIIRAAAAVGLVGGSIEDYDNEAAGSIYDFDHAVERVAAAAEAARALPFHFVLTARAENFLRGRSDLDDTIRRLQAFEKAGADVLFAPALPDKAAIEAVCGALTKPVNILNGAGTYTLAELDAMGARRVSVGSGFSGVMFGALAEAARAAIEEGDFSFAKRSMSYAKISALMD